jgi:hypothetical protein
MRNLFFNFLLLLLIGGLPSSCSLNKAPKIDVLSTAPTPELLFKINASIVKINVATKEGGRGVGSGVVVAKDHIVTNCHVIANSRGVHVTKFGYSYSPHALIADWENDVCILKFKYLELNPVKLSTNNFLEYDDISYSFLSSTVSFDNVRINMDDDEYLSLDEISINIDPDELPSFDELYYGKLNLNLSGSEFKKKIK